MQWCLVGSERPVSIGNQEQPLVGWLFNLQPLALSKCAYGNVERESSNVAPRGSLASLAERATSDFNHHQHQHQHLWYPSCPPHSFTLNQSHQPRWTFWPLRQRLPLTPNRVSVTARERQLRHAMPLPATRDRPRDVDHPSHCLSSPLLSFISIAFSFFHFLFLPRLCTLHVPSVAVPVIHFALHSLLFIDSWLIPLSTVSISPLHLLLPILQT